MKQLAKIQKNIVMMRRGIIAMIALLIVQFIVGMYMNFYTEIPATHPGASGSYAPSIPWALVGHAGLALAIHVTVWLLLTIGGISLIVRAVMSRRKALIIGNSLGLLFILVAGSGGLTFLNRGGADKESFIMALGFILALTVYGVVFYRAKDD